MTRQHDSKDFKDNQHAAEHRSEMAPVCLFSDKYMQIIAWLLLSIGLCIIGSVFYLALFPQTAYRKFSADSHYLTPEGSHHQLASHVNRNMNSIDLDTNLGGNVSNADNSEFDFEFTHLSFLQAVPIEPRSTRLGCKYMGCRLICTRNSLSLYSEVSQLLNDSSCEITSTLVLQEQTQLSISNKWLAATQNVRNIVLTSSKVTHIDRGAFAAPIFATTQSLYMSRLQLGSLHDDALVGLPALGALRISVSLPKVTFAFLQPLAGTLKLLCLNLDLSISSNTSLFGPRQFRKLTHLDLSGNMFDGALKRPMFRTTPHLEVLHIQYAMITSIAQDAFDELAGTLHTLNLAYNELTTLSAAVLRPLLSANDHMSVELEPNNWHCDCLLHAFAELYAQHSNQFMSSVTCKLPLNFYGHSLRDYVVLQQLACSVESITLPPDDQMLVGPICNNVDKERPNGNTSEANISVSCLKPKNPKETGSQSSENVTLTFDPPLYNLELTLYMNQSVKAYIENFSYTHGRLNVIWFSELFENEQQVAGNSLLENNCTSYRLPFLLIDSLNANRTYTFCMMKDEVDTISPLNCQPLHVPPRHADEDEAAINETEKQFTIGMLCLIFFMSTFLGGIIAYFGIKAYPDLLEGSKHVLVVKKSEKTCYISTISETDYITKTASLTKRPLSYSNNKLSETLAEQHKAPSTMSVKEFERLSSLKSASTCFAESFSGSNCQEDEYEMPKSFDKPTDSLQHCKLNNYAMSPSSPPPLPKRNADPSKLVVMHRFSKINDAFEP